MLGVFRSGEIMPIKHGFVLCPPSVQLPVGSRYDAEPHIIELIEASATITELFHFAKLFRHDHL